MTTRLGVDIGGTFTDLIFFDEETGAVSVAKGATTAGSPDEGVTALVAAAVPVEVLANALFFLHGSTVGLNALLERKGARVGLLTTRGFRDILEMRRGGRDDMFGLAWRPPPPLVPRWLRLPVTERLYADGSVHTPLDPADVSDAVDVFKAEGVECVAVVFLHGYANPAHELQAEKALRDAGFDGDVSLSHRVSGEFREYERTSTTTIDAYVRPKVSDYLRRLDARLSEMGFRGTSLVTRSGGGAMTFAEAEQRPFETIMSGPVGGAIGAGVLCRELGVSEAITADVGGTSFDTCLIVDGQPQVKYEGNVAGMPLQCTWVDVRSIGAGGGSIAYVDDGGILRAGPRSAGAVPGPASYGRGGAEPTATDAAALLGMLAFGELAGGVTLDFDRARAALDPLTARLGLDRDTVAHGVLTILSASMANAIRSVTVEQGRDPRRSHLIAFGGAGPLFATLLARELEIPRIVVPNFAGNFSAWGLLCQDVARSAALTSVAPLDDDGLAQTWQVFRQLFEQLNGERSKSRVHGQEVPEAALDLRYSGQEYTLTIPVAWDDGSGARADAATIGETFISSYERTFGHAMEEEVEIVAVRASVRTLLPRLPLGGANGRQASARPARSVDGYSFTRGERLPFAVVDRVSLSSGATLEGPAIVLEDTATTYLDAGFAASVERSGDLLIIDTERS